MSVQSSKIEPVKIEPNWNRESCLDLVISKVVLIEKVEYF